MIVRYMPVKVNPDTKLISTALFETMFVYSHLIMSAVSVSLSLIAVKTPPMYYLHLLYVPAPKILK